MTTPPGPLDPGMLRFDPPDVPLDTIAGVLAEHYGVSGALRPLEGERDQNTLVTVEDGRSFVLKIASPSEERRVADLQCAALRHVAAADTGLLVPEIVPARDGALVVDTDVDGAPAATRLVTFLTGTSFDAATSLPLADLLGVGDALGRLAGALADFEHPAASGFMAWSLDSGMVGHPELWGSLSAEGLAAAAPVRARVERAAAALTPGPELRRHVVHNDGHRGNLLRSDGSSATVTGVIDFGDLAKTFVVADLAICIAGFGEGHDDPVGAAAAIAAGYDRHRPLSDVEIDLLPDLVLTRIVLGLLLVEFQERHAPPHRREDIAAELPGYRSNMAVWAAIDPTEASSVIRRRVRRQRDLP